MSAGLIVVQYNVLYVSAGLIVLQYNVLCVSAGLTVVQYNVLLVKNPHIADTKYIYIYIYKDDTVFSPRVLAVDRHLLVQRIECRA